MSLELRQDRAPDAPQDAPADASVTWLASYPRSGNTLLRLILKRCFGLASQSIYSDAEFSDPALRQLVGHEPIGADPLQFLRRASQDGRRLYVKTHEQPPPDQHRAIYIVRDGRSAVVSHAHFLREILHRDVTLSEIISGKIGISWSKHVRAWTMPARRDLLVLRYEDLMTGDAKMLAALAAFTGARQLQAFDVSFARLHALDPNFFRCGSDGANISEMKSEDAALFERLHGGTLQALGYGAGAASRRTHSGFSEKVPSVHPWPQDSNLEQS
jgi:Sulfotransferase domain